MRVPTRLLPGLHRRPAQAVARPIRRPGYDPTPHDTLRRALPMLEAEPVVWLSTVRSDGRPHLVPTWFWWDGAAIHVWSRPDAVKVRNLRADPHLMVALGRPQDDFAVALIEARAALASGPVDIPEAFFRKYANRLAGAGLDRETFRSTYAQAIRITPTRLLPWRGRGSRHEPERGATTLPGTAGGSLLPAWA